MRRLLIVSGVLGAFLFLLPNSQALGRAKIPPPPKPVVFTGGGIGGWLPRGPLFGFDAPWGYDFEGGYGGGSGGGSSGGSDLGYEWDGGYGGGGSGGGGSCSCGPCSCFKLERSCNHPDGPCDYVCTCKEIENVETQTITHECDGAPRNTGYSCCNRGDPCSGP